MTIKELWKNLARNKQNTAKNSIEYAILRAIRSKADDKVAVAKHLIHKAFTPISNFNKLANGCTPYQKLHSYVTNATIRANGTVLGVKADEFLTPEEIVQFNDIYAQIVANPEKSLLRNYSYFFTRQDIFNEYQLVQTAHAALELGSKLKPEQVKDLYFTCCGVEDLEKLEEVEQLLKSMMLEYVAFREPDIGNQLTSIGVYPISEHRRGVLRKFKLLSFTAQ